MNLIIRLLITAAVAYGLTYVLSGVHFNNFQAAIIFAIVLAILNAIVKPILTILTFPVTIITLGLFLFVINALMIMLADRFMDSMTVDGFWWALIYSILLSIVSGFVSGMVKDKK